MYILGIETSCDETSCAVLKNYKVLSNITLSSLKEHKQYGGVIPEIATRAHLTNIDKVFNLSVKKAGISLKQIDAIAATYKPGLIGALVVGLNFAKALSLPLKKPFIGINHLYAHLIAPFLNKREPLEFPFLGVVVSGGHTELYLVRDFNTMELIGSTQDDAAGEVFDKVARALGLGYPGGPIIDELFNPLYKNEFSFRCGKTGFQVSFSGIKTAVIYKIMELKKKGRFDKRAKIALLSSFQETVVNTLITTIMEAAHTLGVRTVVCGGGVMANTYLRKRLSQEAPPLRLLISPLEYATDNGAIVAGLGFYLYNRKGYRSSLGLNAEAS